MDLQQKPGSRNIISVSSKWRFPHDTVVFYQLLTVIQKANQETYFAHKREWERVQLVENVGYTRVSGSPTWRRSKDVEEFI